MTITNKGIEIDENASTMMDYVDKEYFSSEDFDDGPKVLTIETIGRGTVTNPSTKETKTMLVFSFSETPKKLAVNKTNRLRIKELFGTQKIETLIGKQIVLGVESGNWFGKKDNKGVRVIGKPKAANAASSEKATTTQLKKILDMVDAGVVNQANLLKYYKIEQLNQLSRQQAMEIIRSKTGEVIE